MTRCLQGPQASTQAGDARARLGRIVGPELLALLDVYVREVAGEAARGELANAAVGKPSWYTVAEAARRLGIGPAAVRMRARRGRLVTRRQGRRLYVSAASVDGLDLTANRT